MGETSKRVRTHLRRSQTINRSPPDCLSHSTGPTRRRFPLCWRISAWLSGAITAAAAATAAAAEDAAYSVSAVSVRRGKEEEDEVVASYAAAAAVVFTWHLMWMRWTSYAGMTARTSSPLSSLSLSLSLSLYLSLSLTLFSLSLSFFLYFYRQMHARRTLEMSLVSSKRDA